MTDPAGVLLARLGVPGFVVEAEAVLPCRADPDLFAGGDPRGEARRVCAGCSFVEACRAYGLSDPGLFGTWGGLTRRERQAVRRRGAMGDRGPPGA